MRKVILIAVTLFMTTFSNAQEMKTVQQIVVSGEGKIKVTPDQAIINVGVENTGNDAAEVKKKNDVAIDAILKYLKGAKIPASDYQTKQVSLFKNYDYEKKKHYYQASQMVSITLKDLSKYDAVMMGLVDAGVNTIHGVEFKTSKLAQYESEARVNAVQNAKAKALDYAGALNQKVGKTLLVTDNSSTYYPRPMYAAMKVEIDAGMPRETLAVGEIEVTANVTINFALE
ncbi:SIMPL domain-containing protein [Flavobacterium suncheonense]|uniref:Membrane protein n=1 Tax=Flavobacterium suncheonense GH29-5 = DSM 17707 TaxID=1121899 RepID=A0A0A2M8F8_9FLAO|nr:SIMPL domain-containing protein [Flavobacterium suncheonense]KGO87921.1 membrane protein [Flavobacterium suncheonense GH29-5 = DSM 17707]